jgi:nucleoside-diphosphate-sugar epimerase
MNILLTGGNGFLGSYIYNHLSIQNQIYKLSRTRSNYNCNLQFEIPILDRSFDLIIHAASKVHSIPKSKNEIDEFYKINVQGTLNLLAGLSKIEYPKEFVFISSVSVYGLTTGEDINEEAPLLAKDPYGKSKIEAEQIIKKWCFENNVICTVLRLPLVVGNNPPGNLGAMILGIKKGYYFNIAGGNAKKSMVLATDISKFILKAADIGGTYNLTDGIHPTFNELSKYISKQLGKPFVHNMPIIFAKIIAIFGDIIGNVLPFNSNKLSKITSTLTFDDSKARLNFGWDPMPVLNGFN